MARFSRAKNIKGERWTSKAGGDARRMTRSKRTACEGFMWQKESREAKKQNWKKESLCRGQLWRRNDAWKNIILSLVSTQFVMSFTYSFNRLETEMSHKANVFVCRLTKATLPSDKSQQMTQSNTSQHAEFNSRKDFLLFAKKAPTIVACGFEEVLTYITSSFHLTLPVLTIQLHSL